MNKKYKIDFLRLKKFGMKLLFPQQAVYFLMASISIIFLSFSFIYLKPNSLLSIVSYILSFYTLVIICVKIPHIIKYFGKLKNENKYVKRYFADVRLRMNISLYGSLIWNVSFAVFQLGLGVYHKSFWFYSMFAYYVMLAVMRYFLVKHTRKYKANEEAKIEIKKSIICGYLLIVMNLALAVIVLFMVYFNRTFYHHMITTIALAAYTFLTFTFAIINLVKYRKYKSPIYSSAKTISLIAGAVSMLTLESTMLTTFGTTESPLFSQIMLSLTGAAVIGFALTLAILIIIRGNKKLKEIKAS